MAVDAARDLDAGASLAAQIATAAAARTPLRIQGGGTKTGYGHAVVGTPLEMSAHRGIVLYEPEEFVLTARAGTPLSAIETLLAGQNQLLPFEPPHLGVGATLGGTLACGLSGPRRPYAGAARDFVLGVRLVNGRGEILRCGGRVMKNVAGFDLARLMIGAQGTLGVLLDVSLKVLPRPECEWTLTQALAPDVALARMTDPAARPPLLSGAAYDGERLRLRLSGAERAVREVAASLDGECSVNDGFWVELREQRLDFFQTTRPLWRISLPPAAPLPDLAGDWLFDWGGALRWLASDAPPQAIRAAAGAAGGHAAWLRNRPADAEMFHPLPPGLLELHRRVKQAFDPMQVLNPRRLYGAF